MFRRKKTQEQSEAPPPIEANESAPVAEPTASTSEAVAAEPAASAGADTAAAETAAVDQSAPAATDKVSRTRRGNRVQKVGTVSSDKMQKTVVVRVDRLVLHPKYRRYVRRTSKFMAHDDLGSTTGDRVRIVETRPLSANKRWRVVEIVQKAAK
ncbi:MAG TPA: 30S ribosomal protein S17 [Pyrinomonadaceae bacterium]|nr:30S ribosomal protein S17 [Pyrinomonadaceae bacterium]